MGLHLYMSELYCMIFRTVVGLEYINSINSHYSDPLCYFVYLNTTRVYALNICIIRTH